MPDRLPISKGACAGGVMSKGVNIIGGAKGRAVGKQATSARGFKMGCQPPRRPRRLGKIECRSPLNAVPRTQLMFADIPVSPIWDTHSGEILLLVLFTLVGVTLIILVPQ